MAELSIDQALNLVLQHRAAGRTAEAEGIYRQILAQIRGQDGVLHWLGLLACEAGHLEIAIDLVSRAVAVEPCVATYHSNLGECYRRAGQAERAIASFRRAIELAPGMAQANYNLGLALKERGRLEEAIAAYRGATAAAGDYAEAHNALAVALLEVGRLEEALAASSRAIELKPDQADAQISRGSALSRLGRHEEAIAAYRRAIALRPDIAEAYTNLGNSLCAVGRLDEAVGACRLAVTLRPGLAAAHSNLGHALRAKGYLDESIAAYQQAIAVSPDFADAYSNLGNVLRERGRLGEAVAVLGRAIALKPDHAEALTNLGNALKEQRKLDEAIAAYHRAIALRPDHAAAYSNLGVTLKEKGELALAVEALERAATIEPDCAEVLNNLSSTLLAQGDHEGAVRCCRRALELRPDYVGAHSNQLMCLHYQSGVTLAGLARAHAEWEERHAAEYSARWKPFDLDRDPDRRLRIGFVSPDLGRHPVGFFLARVFESLGGRDCALVCYHTRAIRDDMSHRLAAAAHEWHEAAGLDDDALAARIRDDRIDILFDLSGHTADGRLLLFARRPAPIQVSWIGYVGTTGLKAMDYVLADRFHVPPEAEPHYCERVLWMPDGYVCYDPPVEAPAVGPLPAQERGQITFGCFNNAAKLTPELIALWAEVVRGVPGSRLLLVSPAFGGTAARARITAAFTAAGGQSDCLEFQGALPWTELLAAYNRVDIALDPFPYSGGLTTCEALWMGVPVITCPGETFASRHSFSHLSNVGLTETVAPDRQEYAAIAARLAGDLPHLAAIRAGLRMQMAGSPLCDGPRFAQNFMALLREVWRESWCGRGAQLKPE
jgi:predicted O-linked N-acetylglucosamine transferase (SPINDLY family)